MRRAAVSTIRVLSFMEHFQFNIKLVPGFYDTGQITGDAFKYTEFNGWTNCQDTRFFFRRNYLMTLSVSSAQRSMGR
jgi:hypothetical protein